MIEDPAFPLPRMPCLCCVNDYDGQGMVGFPDRAGWRIDLQKGPIRFDATKSLIESSEALIQAWLFFGLLYDVLPTWGVGD